MPFLTPSIQPPHTSLLTVAGSNIFDTEYAPDNGSKGDGRERGNEGDGEGPDGGEGEQEEGEEEEEEEEVRQRRSLISNSATLI